MHRNVGSRSTTRDTEMGGGSNSFGWLFLVVMITVVSVVVSSSSPDYADALSKSILFFEGQRSGKLPSSQRMTWRKNSALLDGHQIGVDLVGGYYDAGDNVKFTFPMAFSTTMLAWGVLEFGDSMGADLKHALQAIKWATDYFLKATSIPGIVFAQVGDANSDHNCWERPEDMDTLRTPFAVSKNFPGSEVSGEIAAALAASSLVFKPYNSQYSRKLLKRAQMVFNFADTYQGSYNGNLSPWVCPFYCDYSGYHDELLWAATWLYNANNSQTYWNYVLKNIHNLETNSQTEVGFAEFGWDTKDGGLNMLASKLGMSNELFRSKADEFVCSVLPESPKKTVSYSPGGLLFKSGGSNMQHATALSFLLVVHARYLKKINGSIRCDDVVASPSRLIQVAKTQVDYILGKNPLSMSYMVGYGNKFPQRIHHRASSMPSTDQYSQQITCQGGSSYFASNNSNPNLLIGAVVGGPAANDSYADSRSNFVQSEPTTYINAPLVGLLAYFKSNPV